MTGVLDELGFSQKSEIVNEKEFLNYVGGLMREEKNYE